MKQLNILLIDNQSKVIDKLKDLLLTYGQVTVIDYSKILEVDTQQFNLIVLSGSSKVSVKYEQEKLSTEMELVKNSNTPIVGICFGFELICVCFNSEIIELNQEQDDFRVIKIDTNYFKSAPDTIAVKEFHKLGVRKLGSDLQILGTSDSGIEIVKHKNKNIYGFQFHPELYTDLTQGDDLLKIVIGKIFN